MISWPINAAGVQLLKESEGFRRFAYPDPASPLARATRGRRWGFKPARDILATLSPDRRKLSGAPWTIGYGFTEGVAPDDTITEAEADARLCRELTRYADEVRASLTRPATENELAAMVVLAWNIGVAGFRRSSVLRAHNRGDREAAARAFALWTKAGGKVEPGLVRRRAAEAVLYLTPPAADLRPDPIEPEPVPVPKPALDIPQTVDMERPLFQSRIIRTSTVSGTVAGLTLAAEGARAVGDIRASLGDWLPYVALAVVVVGCAIILWERVKMRREGIA